MENIIIEVKLLAPRTSEVIRFSGEVILKTNFLEQGGQISSLFEECYEQLQMELPQIK